MLADTGPGEPDRRELQLVELNWYQAALLDFHWLEKGPIEAIASYTNGYRSNEYLRLPVLWRGNFQKPSDIASVREDMGKVLVEDERWLGLPRRQWNGPRHGDFHSGPGIRRDGPATLVGEQGEQQVFRGNAGHH